MPDDMSLMARRAPLAVSLSCRPTRRIRGMSLRPWVHAGFRKQAIGPIVGLLLSGCVSIVPHDQAKLYARARAAATEIMVGGRIEGSGWFADGEGHVVTAGHVVWKKSGTLEVLWPRHGRYAAHVVAVDRGHDLALLELDAPAPACPHLSIAPRHPAPGAPVFFYGLALFHHAILLSGSVARDGLTFAYFPDEQAPLEAYHVTAPSPPGTSGGPWLDSAGRVVGNQAGFLTHHDAGAGIAIVTPPQAIRRLVRTRQSAATATLGCGLEELWSQSPGFIARFPPGTEGIVTIPLVPGGPVAQAGLTKESLILTFEGQPVRYRDALFAMVAARQAGETVTLQVLEPDTTVPHRVRVTLACLESMSP